MGETFTIYLGNFLYFFENSDHWPYFAGVGVAIMIILAARE